MNNSPEQPVHTSENQETPSAAGEPKSERDGRGRFTAANKGGPGNPYARQTAALRKALVNAVTPEDIEEIAQALKEKARQGDVAASKLLFSYLMGKPAAAVDPDTLD